MQRSQKTVYNITKTCLVDICSQMVDSHGLSSFNTTLELLKSGRTNLLHHREVERSLGLLFEQFLLGRLYVSHAEVLEHRQLHGVLSVVEFLNVNQSQFAANISKSKSMGYMGWSYEDVPLQSTQRHMIYTYLYLCLGTTAYDSFKVCNGLTCWF